MCFYSSVTADAMEPAVCVVHCRNGGICTPTALPPFPTASQGQSPLGNEQKVSDSPSSETSLASNHPVLSWTFDNIRDWLRELHLEHCVLHVFNNHSITNGKILLQLTQENLKEMGIISVGHRLTVSNALDELRSAAGMVPTASYLCTADFMDR